MKLELTATATFGLEAVVRREIEALGCRIIKTEDGRVTYMGDERALVRSNLWLRSADRVYIKLAEFEAREFEELFQQTKGVAWEDLVPADANVIVVGGSVKSALHSVPACQKIIKKAISVRLCEFYCREKLPETGSEYRVRFIAHKDSFVLLLDASGVGLHKRGYRVQDTAAPMKETLAAALVRLSFYQKDRVLVDPCCGSGTIAIEAAMIARNIAPGLGRKFAAEEWELIDGNIWKEERKAAFEAADFDTSLSISGMDIDRRAVNAARANADEAGVIDDIDFICKDMTEWLPGDGIPKGVSADEHGVIISNLPYGIRIGDEKGLKAIYAHIKELMENCPSWSFFLITADRKLEKELGRKADRRRKLYNGQIETQFYQFHGSKPAKQASQKKE